MAAALLTYAHSAGDSTVMKQSLVQALRQLRGQRVEWGEGSFAFTTESGVTEYPFGAYPRLPGGVMALSSQAHCSYSALAGAVLNPDTLVSSVNLTGTITDLQGSAESPGNDFLDPIAAGASSFNARWDVALARPLLPGLWQGAGAQIMRISAYNEGAADRTVTWTVKEGASAIDTGTITINSSTPSVYEIKWDASKLSTLSPAAEQISMTFSAGTGDDVHFGPLQWFTGTRDQGNSVTGGTQPLDQMTAEQYESLIGGRVEVLTALPTMAAIFDDKLLLYPTPNGAYRVNARYQKDSTRDEITGAKITTVATTETNEWFRDGYAQTVAETLKIYHALRTHDAKGIAMAQMVASDSQKAQSLAYELDIFSKAPTGRL